jgi:DNA-binding PucR family transcriptional regulator
VGLAEQALRLKHLLPDDPLFVDEHLDAMLVHRDDRLLAALRRQYLAPLAGLRESTRDRLCETLTSWLLNLGNRKAVAEQLHIHPQTVRYRLSRLRELFGPALDDPATRAALLLALAWGPAVTEADPPAQQEQCR